MGMLNFAFFEDQSVPDIGNLFLDALNQSHAQSSMRMVFNDFQAFSEVGERDEQRLSRMFQEMGLSGHVHACHPQHSSRSGTVILTTDYMVEHIWRLPEDTTDRNVVDRIAAAYRKDVLRIRHVFGREEHPLVTKKKIIKESAGVEAKLPEQAHPGTSLGHFVSLSFDVIDQYTGQAGVGGAKAVSDAYRELCASGDKTLVMAGGPLENYSALKHWASLSQDLVLIIDYEQFVPRRVFVVERERRTPANDLLRQIYAMPRKSLNECIYLDTFVLMREFLASQGITVNL